MGVLGSLLGLPVSGPLLGLGWIARRIAEAADQEMADPARIEAELLALERLLESGDIDEPAFEAREAELLAMLEALRAPQSTDNATSAPANDPDDAPDAMPS
jgi:hypothetical protein